MYHCLVCDGYCIFDLFSQIRFNTHHAPKWYIINFGWCNIHHEPGKNWNCITIKPRKNRIVSLFGLRWVLLFDSFSRISCNTHHAPTNTPQTTCWYKWRNKVIISEAYFVKSLNEATIDNPICNWNVELLILICSPKL